VSSLAAEQRHSLQGLVRLVLRLGLLEHPGQQAAQDRLGLPDYLAKPQADRDRARAGA
jgi:hypothetical protein